jgi:hypothetical protein
MPLSIDNQLVRMFLRVIIYIFFLICAVGLLGTAAITGLLYQPWMSGEGDVEKLAE